MYSFQYIWKPHQKKPENDFQFVKSIFENQCRLYNELVACNWQYKITSLFEGDFYIIQLFSDTTLKQNLESSDPNFKIFHSGFIESEDKNLSSKILSSYDNPNLLQNFTGKFSIIIADNLKKTVFIANSCTEGPSLWHANGKNGIAIGYRPNIICDLSGTQKELDQTTAKIFMGYGYNSSLRSLFKNISRFRTRHYCYLNYQQQNINLKKYASLSEIISKNFNTTLDDAAHILTNRVRLQLENSPNPRLFLTGGYDSRLIAAAAHNVGYKGPCYTYGPKNLSDRVVAKKVADILEWENITKQITESSVNIANQNFDTLLKWTLINDSLETLRHSIAFKDIMIGNTQNMDLKNTQIFHGIQFTRNRMYNTMMWGLTKNSKDQSYLRMIEQMGLFLDKDTHSYLTEFFDDLWQDAKDLNPTVMQFLDIFFWQSKALFWFEDGNNTKMLFSHRWNPLMNTCHISQVWNKSLKAKCYSENHIDLINHLCPKLKDVPFDSNNGFIPELKRFLPKKIRKLSIYHTLRSLRHKYKNKKGNMFTSLSSDFHTLWDNVFSDNSVDFILNDQQRKKLIQQDKNSEMLWSLGSIALFNRTCLNADLEHKLAS